MLERATVLNVETPNGTDFIVTCMVDDADNTDGHLYPILHMPRDTWDDMGQPRQITVTMRPGDSLADADDPTKPTEEEKKWVACYGVNPYVIPEDDIYVTPGEGGTVIQWREYELEGGMLRRDMDSKAPANGLHLALMTDWKTIEVPFVAPFTVVGGKVVARD